MNSKNIKSENVENDSDDSCGGLIIHIEEVEIQNDLETSDQNTSIVCTNVKVEIKNNDNELTKDEKIKLPTDKEASTSGSQDKSHNPKRRFTKTIKTTRTSAKSKLKDSNDDDSIKVEEESDDSDSNMPDDCKMLDIQLYRSAEKNQLTHNNIKKIIRKVVSNDHVLALVKLREEELVKGGDKPDAKLTRAKTKELLKSNPTSKVSWPLPVTPVKVPEIVSPEVSSLILQELPDEESDEEYKPSADYHESDDDKDTITSISDLESLPKTPHPPGEIESPIKYTDDGVFKLPKDFQEICTPEKTVDDEATIALRTRSKLCLSDTPIENIENCFIPPDVPKDLLTMNKNEIDDVWIDFLTEFTKPLSQTHEDVDDEADPEYNAAVEKEKLDSEELRADPEVNIDMDEVQDLLSELIYTHNILEESILDDVVAMSESPIKCTQFPQSQGKLSIEISDEPEVCTSALNTPKLIDVKVESDATTIIPSKNINDSTILPSKNIQEPTVEIITPPEQPPIVSSKTVPTVPLGHGGINRVLVANGFMIKPILNVKSKKTDLPKKPHRPNRIELTKDFFVRVLEHKKKKPQIQVADGVIEFLPAQREILAQQLRQHVQLLAQGYLQLYGHGKLHMHASKQKELLVSLTEQGKDNSNSMFAVQNLKPALDLCDKWEKKISVDSREIKNFFNFNIDMYEKAAVYRKRGSSFQPKFHNMYFDFVRNIDKVFLYPQLLPNMPFRPECKRRDFLDSEDMLIAQGLEKYYEYVVEKPTKFTDSLKIAELITKNLICVKSPVHLRDYIRSQRTPLKNANNLSPIKYYFDNLEAPPTEHKILEYDPTKKVSEFSGELLPKSFQIALGYAPPKVIRKPPPKEDKITIYHLGEKVVLVPNNVQILKKSNILPKPPQKGENLNTKGKKRNYIPKNKYKVNVPTIQEYVQRTRVKNLQHNFCRVNQSKNIVQEKSPNPIALNLDSQPPVTDPLVNIILNHQIPAQKALSAAPEKIVLTDEQISALVNNKSVYVSNPNTNSFFLLSKTPISSKSPTESVIQETSTQVVDVTPEDTNLSVCKEETTDNEEEDNKESIQSDQYSEITIEENSIKEEIFKNVDDSTEKFILRTELCHLINIFKKNCIMLPSMPNLSTPFKSNDIEITYLPSPVNNALPDPSNYKIKDGSLENANRSKIGLTNVQKSKNMPKAQRELEVNQAMFLKNDQDEDQKSFHYARAYFYKIRSELSNSGSKYEELVKTFNAFDVAHESPCDLFQKLENILGEEHHDLAEEFLTFLTPGQAAEIGRFMDHFLLSSISEFYDKLQIYYSKKPGQIKKISDSIQKLIESAEKINQLISVEQFKSAVMPYIKGNQYLVDWFLRLLPEEKPPDSFSRYGYEVLDVGKLAKDDDEELISDHEILNIPAEEITNDDCTCTCHNPNDKLKKKSHHCIACGRKYMQGRIFVQNGKTLRPAHITWEPGSADPTRLLSSITPRLSRKRSFDPSTLTQNRGDSDDERLSPKRPAKQIRTPTSKQKLKPGLKVSLSKLPPDKSNYNKDLYLTSRVDDDVLNDESSNSSLPDPDKLSNSVSWTREEDQEILKALQLENDCKKTLEKMCQLLPHRSEDAIKERLENVMTVLHQIIKDK